MAAFNFPPNLMPIAFQLLGLVSQQMQAADVAFSGQPGSGLKKKEWVMTSVKGLIQTQNLISPDLMTPAQEDATTDTVDKLIEFIFAAVNLAKMFRPKVA